MVRLTALLVALSCAGLALAVPPSPGRNTWSKNKCQPQYYRVGAVPGQSPFGCPTNTRTGINGTFGQYFSQGRRSLTNSYPIIVAFANNETTIISDVQASNAIQNLIERYIKFYMYVMCRCTQSMVPAMVMLQDVFIDGYPGGAGSMITHMQDFVLNPANLTVKTWLRNDFKYLLDNGVYAVMRCAPTSSSGALTPTTPDNCSFKKTNRNVGRPTETVSTSVTCKPTGTCPPL